MGYTVKIGTVMQLAETNYEIAEQYAKITRKIADTDDGRAHLTDHFGNHTEADKNIHGLLDEFENYLKTTTARYYRTAEQLETAAGRYVEQENRQQDEYKKWRENFEDNNVGEYDLNWNPEETAKDTDRPEGATDEQPGEFGTEENSAEPDEVGDFQTEMSLSDNVDSLFLDRDAEKGWRVDWTGSAADRVAEGIFASTKPTLSNHAILANGLGTLINRRATMIHTYRENNLNLVNGAIKALGAEVEEKEDSSGLWNAMAGIGTAVAIPPSAAPAGTSILLLAWLGEQLVGSSTTVSFEHHPGDVANKLYDEIKKMNKDLDTAEQEYTEDVKNFRENLDDVPSTFLELYDITENASTGTP